jgi:hypothetical protein
MSPTTNTTSSSPNVPTVQLVTESVIAAYIDELSERRRRSEPGAEKPSAGQASRAAGSV